MRISYTCLLLLSILPLSSASGQSSLNGHAEKPQLLALLRANYVDSSKLPQDCSDLNRVIAESHGGVSVELATKAILGMYSAVLPGNVVYWRVSSFTPATSWTALAGKINSEINSPGLVLDLRSNTTPDDFRGALQVANFVSAGQSGLSSRGEGMDQTTAMGFLRGRPTTVVLVDHKTCGAAEALAACLQAKGALVMGEKTEGRAAIFKEVPLSSGGVLRYATAHVYLSNGTDLWDRPVVPDVTITEDRIQEENALALIDHQQVGSVIEEEQVRHRMCEAALVKGLNPEQDQLIAAQEHRESTSSSSLLATRDLALIEAIDSLKVIRVLQTQEMATLPRVAVDH